MMTTNTRFFSKDLKRLIINNASQSDEVIIISGYVGPSIIKDVFDSCQNTTVVYGMYGRDGISEFLHKSLCKLSKHYPKANILYCNTGVHAKCYVFKKNKKITTVLIGSANLSEHGLTSPDTAEILSSLPCDDFIAIDYYIKTILMNCIDCKDTSIVASSVNYHYPKSTQALLRPVNPLSTSMPLFIIDRETKEKITHAGSGLNWGNASNNHKTNGPMEACIPISAKHIDNYPLLFPPKQLVKNTSDGKISRVNDPIEIIWDDGYIMKAIFSGNGPRRNDRLFPKQLTSNDGGGAELGGYIRHRMGLSERHVILYSDLVNYGRDNIQLTFIQEGVYAADFSI